MLTKQEIVEDIISIVHNDYAGYIDKPGQDDYAKLRNIVANPELTDEAFFFAVSNYLAAMQDGHLRIVENGNLPIHTDFLVRRFENSLFVIHTTNTANVEVGDEIVAIDGLDIATKVKEYKYVQATTDLARQEWRYILEQATTITLSTGAVLPIHKSNKGLQLPDEHYYRELDAQTGYLKLGDFEAAQPIKGLIDQYGEEITSKANLIIDVRVNYGGSDLYYYPLMDYIFPNETTIQQIFAGNDDFDYFNLTERNVKSRERMFAPFFDQPDLSAEIRDGLNKELAFYRAHRGEGWVERHGDDEQTVFAVHGQATPQNIVVLSDVYCGSSGDQFVDICKLSPKVTVMGRNTMGITDYSNVICDNYDLFTLVYPTSRTSLVANGHGISGIGVAVDIEIPWTPAHLQRDVDLDEALAYLRKLEN
ncbi:MAG: hypothetical protein LBT80_07625 [Lactobacillaceae bacterium]|jgi:C-terminal processing protease CtpA/Prc|nr:hypothetical protein [Lactobacillaceae bacterium]